MAKGPVMTPGKRAFDISFALLLALLLWPVIAIIALLILLRDGGPVFYVAERMQTPDRAFGLVKFRTMRTAAGDSGVTGGDKAGRITRTGRVLRRTRLDELPQLWNILRGDMSFVGPRPPLRRYVELRPKLYARVLASRPGVTGLASLTYADHEDRLLARCQSADETEAVYVRSCVPRKARLDLIWQARRNLCLDLWIMWETLRRRVARR